MTVSLTELDLLRQSSENHDVLVTIHVNACSFSCCGHGWHRRDGYWQQYFGYVDALAEYSFMLISPGIGTVSYMIAARFGEVESVDLR